MHLYRLLWYVLTSRIHAVAKGFGFCQKFQALCQLRTKFVRSFGKSPPGHVPWLQLKSLGSSQRIVGASAHTRKMLVTCTDCESEKQMEQAWMSGAIDRARVLLRKRIKASRSL